MEQYYSQKASSILWNQFEKQLFGNYNYNIYEYFKQMSCLSGTITPDLHQS